MTAYLAARGLRLTNRGAFLGGLLLGFAWVPVAIDLAASR